MKWYAMAIGFFVASIIYRLVSKQARGHVVPSDILAIVCLLIAVLVDVWARLEGG